MKKNQHVVPNNNGGWSIKGAGNSKYTAHFETQAKAIEQATKISKNQRSELVIHGKNGQIREKNSYGNDPFPPKG
ncbi:MULTISPECIES: DUF2188 domain-containing protein [Enterococcus]|uniref:DUF2188 domain-containing protein n=1 Tax=Enterococcus faecalis TaxID=1351 RepID=A0AAW7KDT1_ENTFL|nr:MULTISPECIES: DUF2188 domain-containing protein [Enterococcus]HAP4941427.1 DUF2188 domain-containing protein [Enterococcus faecalis ADL-123]EGO2582048.1 DUF2188 domain-containing protein [Enterococcus faecalis]EGO6008398.1 DUF2188 domain-containing protein [Enterococcus faecalis]EGO6146432.1 DUF2188 domain-containing protein [Enterococcus faecalis]EGO6657258.1 DUF2188 domain-containing protein [Enterococcus faecalis]